MASAFSIISNLLRTCAAASFVCSFQGSCFAGAGSGLSLQRRQEAYAQCAEMAPAAELSHSRVLRRPPLHICLQSRFTDSLLV